MDSNNTPSGNRRIGSLFLDLEEELPPEYYELSEQECMAIMFSTEPCTIEIPIDPYQDVQW